jgi:uncharacterized protein YaiE (UPF0345 family)
MTIMHTTHSEGRLHKLSFVSEKGKATEVYVVEPGNYNLGVAKAEQFITILHGRLETLDGRFHMPSTARYSFNKGQQIIFTASITTVFLSVSK